MAIPSDERSGVDELLAAIILEVDGQELSGRDLLAAGIVSGRWQRLERELAEGLELVIAHPPVGAEITEAVRAFRVERGLLSGEDLQAWLKERRLTFGSVKAAAARTLARHRGGTRDGTTAAGMAAALPAEAVCTGALREISLWLADRILSAASRAVDAEPTTLEHAAIQRLVFEEARSVAGSTSGESGVERAERLGRIAALDTAFRQWEAQVTADAEVARRLRENELEWCGFQLDEFRLSSAGAAAEAARQLVEGIDPGEIAVAAGVPHALRHVVMADAPPELARVLAGAVAGDVVGPWHDGDVHVVARVRARAEPDLDDAEIVARARDELMADAAARLRTGRLVWHGRA